MSSPFVRLEISRTESGSSSLALTTSGSFGRSHDQAWGTGTPRVASPSTCSAVDPPAMASGVSTSRCASTVG